MLCARQAFRRTLRLVSPSTGKPALIKAEKCLSQYVVISSPKSPAAAHEYINSTLSILGQPPSPIIGVSAVERIQSAGIRHICQSSSTLLKLRIVWRF